MDFPKTIGSFVLHDVRGGWTFRGQPMQAAHYIRIGTRVGLIIGTEADPAGTVSYVIRLRDSAIRGIASLEEAVRIAEEVIRENADFIGRHSMLEE